MNVSRSHTSPSRLSSAAQSDLLDELLAATSRTFGLAIPILPAGLREQVAIAYLLFRLADTIEDGHFSILEEKLVAFDRFAGIFESSAEPNSYQAAIQSAVVSLHGLEIDNPDYVTLVEKLPEVVAAWHEMEEKPRTIVANALVKSARGMRQHVAAGGGNVQINTLRDLRDYCYFVAGIVGEMLTDLFIHCDHRLETVADALRALAPQFGEGLQMVNVLKDEYDDEAEGRRFVPPDDCPSESRLEVQQIARSGLEAAQGYVDLLVSAKATPQVIAFCDLPIQLAWPTLQCIAADGPGTKVDRQEVATILADVYARAGILPKENATQESNNKTNGKQV